MRARTDDPLTFEQVRKLFFYDQGTGSLRWKIQRHGAVKVGDDAGCFDSRGVVVVTVNGKLYTAARLIWMWVTGKWPKGRVRYKNKNSDDLRYANLYDEGAVAAPTKNAERQRVHRADLRAIEAAIAKSAALRAEYAADPKGVRAQLLNRRKAERQRWKYELGEPGDEA